MDPSRVAAIAAAFDLGAPEGPPVFVARGSMGRLWRLRTRDGRSWAVKALFDWGPPEPTGTDVSLQEAAAAAGISLPTPRRAVDGRVVVDRVRVYEWVDLEPLGSPAADAGTLEEAGRILGTLHALALRPDPGEAVDDWYRVAPAPARLAELADEADAAGRSWARSLRDQLDRLAELGALVDASPMRDDDVIVCHADFTSDNVFRRASGGGELVVVDWENAGPLSAEAELAMTVAAWCPSSDPSPFLAGYAAAGGTASIAGPGSFAANTATRLNYLKVMAEQSLADDEHRSFADAAVERLLRVEMDAAVPPGWMA